MITAKTATITAVLTVTATANILSICSCSKSGGCCTATIGTRREALRGSYGVHCDSRRLRLKRGSFQPVVVMAGDFHRCIFPTGHVCRLRHQSGDGPRENG